jgi:hypothetical protein
MINRIIYPYSTDGQQDYRGGIQRWWFAKRLRNADEHPLSLLGQSPIIGYVNGQKMIQPCNQLCSQIQAFLRRNPFQGDPLPNTRMISRCVRVK